MQREAEVRLEDREQTLELELTRLRSEHYNLSAEHSAKSEQLASEMANSVNWEYVKNIMISFFSSSD